jgi:hypothetical protein
MSPQIAVVEHHSSRDLTWTYDGEVVSKNLLTKDYVASLQLNEKGEWVPVYRGDLYEQDVDVEDGRTTTGLCVSLRAEPARELRVRIGHF